MGALELISNQMPVIAGACLFLTALGLGIYRLARPSFGAMWLVASAGTIVSWLMILASRPDEPRQLISVEWQPQALFQTRISFVLDPVSWTLGLALIALLLAVILTDAARTNEADWSAWAGGTFLTGLGYLAVLAGNPLTLLLAWSAIDIAELVVLLWHIPNSQEREKIIVSFSARIAGVMLLFFAKLSYDTPGQFMTFQDAPANISVYMIVAAGLRLGVVPLHLPLLQESALRRGLGTILRLVPAASSLMLLARIASVGLSPFLESLLLGVTGLTALFSALSWALATDELEGRPFWILALSAFALAAAVRGQPQASLAWGTALLFSGGVIFLTSIRQRNLLIFSMLGIWGFSILPFSPAWKATSLYAAPFNGWLLLFPLAHILLVAGFFMHAIRRGESLVGAERWVGLIYPLGLGILPVMHLYVGLQQLFAGESLAGLFTLVSIWPGLLSLVLLLFLWWFYPRLPSLDEATHRWLRSVLAWGWFFSSFWWSYRAVGRLMGFISRIFEGDGGVLWSFLVLALLLAFLSRGGI